MYCLRCGREVPDGASFCEECAETVREPLVESTYLSKRITLPPQPSAQQPKPTRRAEKKRRQEEKREQKSERKELPRSRRLIAAVVCLSLCCALLCAGCVYGVILYRDSRREHTLLTVQQEENARLNQQIANLNADAELQQETLSELRGILEERDLTIAQQEELLNDYRKQGSATDQTQRELEEKNAALEKENEDYGKQLEALEKEKSSLTSRVDTLEDQVSALRTKSEFIDRHVVFVENDGTKYYHSYDCPRFKKKSYWAYSTNLAVAEGYSPCPDCQ